MKDTCSCDATYWTLTELFSVGRIRGVWLVIGTTVGRITASHAVIGTTVVPIDTPLKHIHCMNSKSKKVQDRSVYVYGIVTNIGILFFWFIPIPVLNDFNNCIRHRESSEKVSVIRSDSTK